MKALVLLFLALPVFAQDFYDEDVAGQELRDDDREPPQPQIIYIPSDCGIEGLSLDIEKIIAEEKLEEVL